jgi:hypothetical protein
LISFSYLTALIFSGIKLAAFFKHNLKLAASGICLVGILFLVSVLNSQAQRWLNATFDRMINLSNHFRTTI